MAASFYESLEERSSRLFFFVVRGWVMGVENWVLDVDEVLRGGRMGYYIGLMGRIGLIWLIRKIRLIKQIGIIGLRQLGLIVH